MVFPGRILKLLAPALIVAVLTACATQDQDVSQSLRLTKQRLDEAKQNENLRGSSTQFVYEADLYWRRAAAAQDDSGKAQHLLFMAQGKLAMAQSVAALQAAEKEIKANRDATKRVVGTTPENRSERVARSGNGTKVVSADTKTPPPPPAKPDRDASNAPAAKPTPQAAPTQVASASVDAPVSVVATNMTAKKTDPKDDAVAVSDVVPEKTESPAGGNAPVETETTDTALEKNQPAAKKSDPTLTPAGLTEQKTVPATTANRAKPAIPAKNPVPVEKPDAIQSALLTKVDEPTGQMENDKTAPTDRPDKHPAKKTGNGAPGNARRSTGPEGFHVNIPDYCKRISAMVNGGKDIEMKCRELETGARKRLATLNSDTALYASIYKYCSNVARALGSGYQIMELCVDQEVGAKPEKPATSEGIVLGERKTGMEEAAKGPKPATKN